MKTLIICRGIPGSGKSYWAAQQTNCVVVTRDDIRKEYNCVGDSWSKHMELDYVVPEMNRRIREGFKTSDVVISADTNLNPAVIRHLVAVAELCGAKVEIHEFNTPLEVCIERDSKREYPWKVGEEGIRRYHDIWVKLHETK